MAKVETVETVATIKRKAPTREAFAGCSTNGVSVDYYETKGHAVSAFNAVLERDNLCFDLDDCGEMDGDSGRKTIPVIDEYHNCVAFAYLSWYRMPSGRYEVTGYLG
jgi:hypothetical protein